MSSVAAGKEEEMSLVEKEDIEEGKAEEAARETKEEPITDGPSAAKVLQAAIGFSASSIGMILLNKEAITVFPNAGFLLVFQNTATVVILYLTKPDLVFKSKLAAGWSPCAFLFCLNIFSSLESMKYVSVPTFTVLRNTQPILSVFLDYTIRREHTSWTSFGFLVVVFLGALIYGWKDLGFSFQGYVWGAIHILSMSVYAVSVKLYGSKLQLTPPEMSLYNNCVSLPVLALLACTGSDESQNFVEKVRSDLLGCSDSFLCIAVVAASCFGGYCVSVAGFSAQQVMSPTSWLALNNISKIPAIIISFVIFGGSVQLVGAAGMVTALGGGYLYALSRQDGGVKGALGYSAMCVIVAAAAWGGSAYVISSLFPGTPIVPWEQWRAAGPFANCKVWGAVSTIAAPTAAAQQLLDMGAKGAWTCLVVAGDVDGDHLAWEKFAMRNKRAVYLGPWDQRRLPLQTVALLPWRHASRVNVAYLFAAAMGADYIWDFHDDNVLQTNAADSLFRRITHGKAGRLPQLQRQTHLYNPYPDFKPRVGGEDVLVWPRGFPLDAIHDARTSRAPLAGDVSSDDVALYQGVSNTEPDTDAIYRMTARTPVTFTAEDTVRVLPNGVFAPWNSRALLVRADAFWGLLTPATVTGRVADIWRSYLTSRLMFESGQRLAFMSAMVTQVRRAHDNRKDFADESVLYSRVDDVVRLLCEFAPRPGTGMDQVAVELYKYLARNQVLSKLDVDLAVAWRKDLASIHYTWPQRKGIFTPFTPPPIETSAVSAVLPGSKMQGGGAKR